MTLSILVVGAGAVGGYFGGRLSEAGRDVTFLVRPARAQALREQGLQIESPLGDLRLTPSLVEASDISRPYDLVFLSLKSYALEAALEDFAPAVGPTTVILPVLNGLQHIARLITRFGPRAVIGGVCRIGVQLHDGRIRHMSPLQQIAYGELDGSASDRLAQVDEVMQGVGFDATLSGQIFQDMWDKWIQLAALGAINSLLDAPIGPIASAPDGAATAAALWAECVDIATRCGLPPKPAYAATILGQLTDPDSPLTSSMYRDKRAGDRVEVESILGDLLTRGRRVGVEAPLLQAATVALRVYAAKRATAS